MNGRNTEKWMRSGWFESPYCLSICIEKPHKKEYNCSIHELYDPKLEYPEDIEW